MRSTLIPLAVILSSIFFVSCQREVDERLTDITSGDTIKIKSITYLDTTLPVGQDTLEFESFEYDQSGRVIHIGGVSFSTGFRTSALSDYNYYGTDSVPYKVTNEFPEANEYDTTYFFYQGGNIISKDSAFYYWSSGPPLVQVETYQSLSDGGYCYLSKYGPSSSNLSRNDSIKYRTSIVNGNLVSEIDSSYDTNGELSQITNGQFNFDQKNNPINYFLKYRLPGEPFIMPGFQSIPGYRNNMVNLNSTFVYYSNGSISSTDNYNEIYIYQYNSLGYPLSVIWQGNYDQINKVIYTYY